MYNRWTVHVHNVHALIKNKWDGWYMYKSDHKKNTCTCMIIRVIHEQQVDSTCTCTYKQQRDGWYMYMYDHKRNTWTTGGQYMYLYL